MRPKEVKAAFERFLDGRPETPAAGIISMLSFYRSRRVRGCDLESDGDMLLFQWGTYDWGQGEHFEVDITRQLVWDDRGWLARVLRVDEDPEIWQLYLTHRFEPTDGLRALGSGNVWCEAPSHLTEFEDYVCGTPAFVLAAERTDGTRLVGFDSAE